MIKPRYRIFIYAALPCEAKPIIEFFRLKKDVAVEAFAIYGRDELCLAVSGVGKAAMAAAVAYTQALYAANTPRVFLNVGIAGHKELDMGGAFLINKINDIDTGKNYYPQVVFKTAYPTMGLQTVSKPVLDYPSLLHLYDMEASAFYETASRFGTGELIHCLKVISDNQITPANNLQPQQVTQLIAEQMPTIENILAELKRLAQLIHFSEPDLLAALLTRYRFTVSEQAQLKNQLNRWQVLSDNQTLPIPDDLPNGSAVLQWLGQQIAGMAYSL